MCGLQVRRGWQQDGGTQAEKALQKQDGGDLINGALARDAVGFGLDALAGLVEKFVRGAGGEALVEAVKTQAGVPGFDLVGEGAGLASLRGGLAGEVDRVAEDQIGDLVAADQASDGFKVDVRGLAKDGQKRGGQDVERIRNADADAGIADVEREDAVGAGGRGIVQVAGEIAGVGFWAGVGGLVAHGSQCSAR